MDNSSNPQSLKKINVMIIDDDEATNFLTSYVFLNYYNEFSLTFEVSAKSALNKLAKNINNLPDLILLDINMPEMNGWDFLKEYQEQNFYSIKKTAIFMVSSSIIDSDKLIAKTFNEVVDYIEKPLCVEKIHLISKKLLNSR